MSFLTGSKENLQRLIPGYVNLRPIEKKRINEFSLVWQLFEGQVFDYRATGQRIVESNWFAQNAEEICERAAAETEYFRDRYWSAENAEARLNSLLGQQREAMRQCILRGFETEEDQNALVRSCGAICFRLRNNLFHGTKAAYGFNNQCANFTHGVRFLNTCLNVLA